MGNVLFELGSERVDVLFSYSCCCCDCCSVLLFSSRHPLSQRRTFPRNRVTHGLKCFFFQKADLAAASLTVTESREKVVDFTVAYMYFTSSMIMKKKSASPTDFLQFMMPFDIPVWLMLLACLTVVSIGTFVLNYYSPFGYKDETGRGTSSEFNFPNSLWFSLACMLQQGGDNTPKALSGEWRWLISYDVIWPRLPGRGGGGGAV